MERDIVDRTKERLVPIQVNLVYQLLLHGLFAGIVEELILLEERMEMSFLIEILKKSNELFFLFWSNAPIVMVEVRLQVRIIM